MSQRPGGGDVTVLSTVGMSCQRMPVVEQMVDDPSGLVRVELALAVSGSVPAGAAARVFGWLGTYPWQAVTWFGPGHTVRWPSSAGSFPLAAASGQEGGAAGLDGVAAGLEGVAAAMEGIALLDAAAAGSLPGPEPPDLSGFSVSGDPVRWLWVVPITEPDRQLARDRGSAALISRMTAGRRGWVAGVSARAG
jgi:hypothetical protein